MTVSFRDTLRALDTDGSRGPHAGLLVATLLLLGWGVWFFEATVPVYKRSERARLELVGRVSSVSSTAPGRVVAVSAELGRAVEAGAVLVQLDTTGLADRLAELEAEVEMLAGHRDALARQLAIEEGALAQFRESAAARLLEERARSEAAAVLAAAAEDEALRLERLREGGVVPELDLVRSRARAEESRARAEALRLGLQRLEPELRVQEEDRRAEIEELRVERTRLDGAVAVAAAGAARTRGEIGRCSLRAPEAGVVAERLSVGLGSAVAAGQELVTLAHPGPVQVTAHFPAAGALGHLRPGQPARLSLTGFPWSEYGSLAARVVRVGQEAREGAIEVELELAPAAASRIPVQHGLTARVEVEVERVAPATLVLRAAGVLLGGESGGPPEPRPEGG